MKAYRFHPGAAEEYTAAGEYYAAIQSELGGRFFDEIERLIDRICNRPDLFRIFDAPARRNFSTVFPFAIIYVDLPESVLILAVMNCKRRPGYWKSRLD